MERLPYIDEHARLINTDRTHTWNALLRTGFKNPADLTTAPRGFVVGEVHAPIRMTLRGRHWFSKYALVFELDEVRPQQTRLRAQSWATFPGLHGRIYRALVIGTGMHQLVVRDMLRRIEKAADDTLAPA